MTLENYIIAGVPEIQLLSRRSPYFNVWINNSKIIGK